MTHIQAIEYIAKNLRDGTMKVEKDLSTEDLNTIRQVAKETGIKIKQWRQ